MAKRARSRERRTPGGAATATANRPNSPRSAYSLRIALLIGAVIWGLLVIAGFFAPGGWTWGMAGPIGHMENYMISLWVVGLVLAPLLASRAPLSSTGTIQVYLLAVLAVVVSTFRGEELKWIADAPPIVAALIAIGLVVWFHPDRSALWRL
jgi:hypothetical protein